jgi:23S rRNA (guanosine2251-2'-O)-methyltransferase
MSGKLVHGLNAVREALRASSRVNRVYVAREAKSRATDEILDLAREARVPFDFVPLAKLNSMTGTGDHQGVAAGISPVEYVDLADVLANCGEHACLLALDQVQHPRNLGMIIRTAVGAGANALLVPARGGALLDDQVVRASAGTVMHLPIVPCANLSQTLRQLKEKEFWIYGLAGQGKQSVFKTNWGARSVLVMGSESKGIRPGVAKVCDDLLRIPLANDLDSLNVAVAAGIALFQATRAR